MSSQIIINCFHESGIFKNGNIISFRDDTIYEVKNKEHTLYGEYYRGLEWKNNFKELLNDINVEIYEVKDKKGNRFKIGDYTKSLNGIPMMITSFIVDSDKYIRVYGIEIRKSMAIL